MRLPDSDAEHVLQTERSASGVDLKVASVEEAVAEFVAAGGHVAVPAFDIRIGRCAVVQDRWGNQLTVLDMSKGRLVTDADGNMLGPPERCVGGPTARRLLYDTNVMTAARVCRSRISQGRARLD